MSLTFYTKTPANASAGECKFVSSGCWYFFVFRNSEEKLCVSWALPFVECVAVWALKLPAPHTDVLKPTSHKVFLRNYWNPNKLAIHIDTNLHFPNPIKCRPSTLHSVMYIFTKITCGKYSIPPYCHYETKKSNGV